MFVRKGYILAHEHLWYFQTERFKRYCLRTLVGISLLLYDIYFSSKFQFKEESAEIDLLYVQKRFATKRVTVKHL